MDELGVGMAAVWKEVVCRWPGHLMRRDYLHDVPEAGLEWFLSAEARALGPKLKAAWALVDALPKTTEQERKYFRQRARLVQRWFRQVMVGACIRAEQVRTD